MKIRANAKINLFLDIHDKTNDGYHNVEMIMQSISLHDTIEMKITSNRKISISSNYSFDIDEKDNTVFKAADLFFKTFKIKNPGIHISITKGIPVCAGLAGGSADAAAVLLGLNKIFDVRISNNQLLTLASKVGADVPFCLTGGTSVATGIGTNLKSISKMPECWIVVVKPDLNVSTQYAYEQSDKIKSDHTRQIKKIISAIENQDLETMCREFYNRFEEVLNLEEVKKIQSEIMSYYALGTSMSGSGPTVFGVFTKKANAEKCVENLKHNYSQTFLCTPVNNGCSFIL